ncbi:hypothetical protein SVXHx_3150 (plasmid) [Haloferax volcanii]|nr:hypothetical protein SVXHx_3150 [Haloferax lucentense]
MFSLMFVVTVTDLLQKIGSIGVEDLVCTALYAYSVDRRDAR